MTTGAVAYSPGQRAYFSTVIAAGATVAAASAAHLFVSPPPNQWALLAALTLLTGSFTIRIPRLSLRVSVSDAFVFASALIYGSATATVIVAIDSLVATMWMRPQNRTLLRSAYNLAVASLSIWTASQTFHWLAGDLPSPQELQLTSLIWPLFVLAASYFLLNSWMIAAALSFEQNAKVGPLWWKHFPWFSLNYFGGVSAAGLLVSYTRSVDIGAVSIILPLLLISYLTYRTSLGRIQDAQAHLDQMNELYMSTIEALAMAVDAKDQITHGHIRRVQVYAVELAKRLGVSDDQHLKAIETAALLHDMGKLAIPEHILNKPGKLTTAEFDKMKRHADIGADLLSSIKFPYPVVPIVRYHHEQWNGGGYPSGIGGTDIPVGARILAVVDCFDALTSDRPYRPRLSDTEAFAILREREGSMYDPWVVESFIQVHSEIAPIAIKAGQEARSMISLDATIASELDPLKQIRSNAFEASVIAALSTMKVGMPTSYYVSEVARHLKQLTPATVYAIFRYDTDGDQIVCTAASGPSRHLIEGLAIPLGERVVGWTAANQRPSLNSDAYLDLGPAAEMFEPVLRSVVSVPMTWGGSLAGVVAAYGPAGCTFSNTHLYILEHVAETLAAHLSSPPRASSKIVAFTGASRPA